MRRATELDIEQLVMLCSQFKDTQNYTEHTYNVDYIYNNLINLVNNPKCDIFIIERDGLIIGAAAGLEHQTVLCPDVEYSELFVICSDPRGTIKLINGLEASARNRCVKRMTIGSSTADNPRYCALLEHKGFTPFGRSFRKVL